MARTTPKIDLEQLFLMTNQARVESKLGELTRSQLLDKIAQEKLNDMLVHKYWAHNNPASSTSQTPYNPYFFNQNNYYGSIGENLAKDFNGSNDKLFGAWRGSPTHWSNIVSPKYSEIGFATDGNIVVQMFGSGGKPKASTVTGPTPPAVVQKPLAETKPKPAPLVQKIKEVSKPKFSPLVQSIRNANSTPMFGN